MTSISSVPSGRQTEADGWTGPPCLADDIKHLGSLAGEDRDAVGRKGHPGDGSPPSCRSPVAASIQAGPAGR